MTTPYRLLYVVNEVDYFLSHRLPLALAAQKAGYDVHVATPHGTSVAEVEKHGFHFHPIFMTRRSMRPWSELRSVLSLYRLYRKLRPELIHHLTIKPVIYGSLIARLTRQQRVVNTITGMGYVFIQNGIFTSLLRRIVKGAYRVALKLSCHKMIFQNLDDYTFFVDAKLISVEEAALIKGSGVNLDEFPFRMDMNTVPLVLLASRMLWHKGVGEFIEAVSLLGAQNIRARFVLVGDSDPGNPAAISTSQLKTWSDSKLIEWWGYQTNMAHVIAQSSIVCLPSYREGVPRILIEAAASGKAIVATDVPGCREIVRHGENGLLVPPRDSRALATALQQLIVDSNLREKMGRRGRTIAEEFSEENVICKTLALYEELRACHV